MSGKKKIKHDPIVIEFAKRLRHARTTKSLSQKELSQRSRVNVTYLAKLERAEAAPGLDMVARLSRALGIRPSLLIEDPAGKRRSELNVVKAQVRQKIKSLLARNDLAALQAFAVLAGLADNAVARRND